MIRCDKRETLNVIGGSRNNNRRGLESESPASAWYKRLTSGFERFRWCDVHLDLAGFGLLELRQREGQ